ncbi:MAG: ABC transporter ATPase [Flavobacteriales bacterium]|nr:ABC transporter ATPase [Flavobacteriales bacterium]
MLVNFNTIPEESRIWIYTAEQKLTNEQESYILQSISDHIKNWEAHKVPLTAGVAILENHFIVVALDETKNGASGCSIDTLQKTIQELEKDLSIALMNRLNVFCKIGEIIKVIPSFKLGVIANEDTLFYDLTIQRKEELSNYLKPIKEGWAKSYL